jgi:hypothetical protein
MNDKRKAYEMSKATCHAADSPARSLAEAIILQSIEDLWNPVMQEGKSDVF